MKGQEFGIELVREFIQLAPISDILHLQLSSKASFTNAAKGPSEHAIAVATVADIIASISQRKARWRLMAQRL